MCEEIKSNSSKMDEEEKNSNFVQMNKEHLNIVAKIGENTLALKVFLFLCKNMDGLNALCISMKALTELLNVSRQSISKAIKYLKDMGAICVLKNGTSNVYVVNPSIAWTSYSNKKKYCKFKANVILTSSENDMLLKHDYTVFKKINEHEDSNINSVMF